MSFADICGHEKVLSLLRRAMREERLSHAYLFSGPEGIGKWLTAVCLAKALHCAAASGEGCGICQSCRQIPVGTHPDVVLLGLAPGKREIAIEQVRDLQRLLALRPVWGKKKVAIIDNAHSLNGPAQNALLKTMEEPPGDSLLILIIVNSDSLLRTILSRCQTLRFFPLSVSVLQHLLINRHNINHKTAHLLALHGQGSIGRALSLQSHLGREEYFFPPQRMYSLSGKDFVSLAQLAQELVATEESLPFVLEMMLLWYRDVLRYRLLGRRGILLHHGQASRIKNLADTLHVHQSLRHLRTVYDTLKSLRGNANRSLAVEKMLLQLTTLSPQ